LRPFFKGVLVRERQSSALEAERIHGGIKAREVEVVATCIVVMAS
jgi:hypothetical protein